MINNHIFAIGLSSVFLVSGCTSLKSTPVIGQPNTPPGFTYRLPAKQFSVKAIYQVNSCMAKDGKIELGADVSASYAESLVGAEAYTVDYQKLNTWTKITNTEFTLSDWGFLTGVNASIADQTGTIVKNTVTAVAGVARAVALPMPVSLPYTQLMNRLNNVSKLDAATAPNVLGDLRSVPAITKNYMSELHGVAPYQLTTSNITKLEKILAEVKDPCSPVTKTLTDLNDAKSSLKTEQGNDKKRAKETEKIAQASIEIESLKNLVTSYEKLGNVAEKNDLLNRIIVQEKEITEAKSILQTLGESKTEKIIKDLADTQAKLTVTASSDFVPMLSEVKQIGNKKVFEATIEAAPDGLKELLSGWGDLTKVALPQVVMSLEPLTPISNAVITPESDKLGIVYRIPVTTSVRVKLAQSGNESLLLSEKITQVPQFGPIGSLNLDNKIFDNNQIAVSFNGTTGSPSKVNFTAKSKAESASVAASEMAGAYLQLKQNIRDDQLAFNKALLEQSASEVALEKSKSELSLSQAQSGITVATAQAQSDLAVANAQLQLIKGQQEIEAIKNGTATTAVMELQALKTQEGILNQRLKIMKLEQQIAEQQAISSLTSSP